MIKIHNNLFIGNEYDCFYDDREDWVVIHACKSPCHQRAVGYRGNLNKNHPNYLILEKKKHLFLNMVDMDTMLSHEYTGPIVKAALDFIERNIDLKNIIVHCNLGISRSPALAMLFLTKRKNILPNSSYKDAKIEFTKLFTNYVPGIGIDRYLDNYWNDLK